ncbi:MAG: hypothetical protein ABI614_04980 [Planctomycetota bacterium]
MLDPMQAPADRNNQIRVAITSLALASFGLVPVFVADSIKLSNRFVGPIVRLQTVIRQVGKGKPVELKFRDGDFWTDLPDDFNRMVERLEARSPSKWWEPGSESELVNAATTSES